MYDIIIIGGGIVGTTLARRLSRYSLKILLLEKEKDLAMGATKGNSAIVHGGYAESHESLKGRLCYQGRRQFRRLNEELNFGFKETGSLVITKNEKDLKFLEELLENGKKNGLEDLEILNKTELLKIESNLKEDVVYGLHCKGAGVCSPFEMAIAMAENAQDNGVEILLERQVLRLRKTAQGILVETNQESFETRFVINAAGLYADDMNEMMNKKDFIIQPRTGEYIVFQRGTGKILNQVIFQMPTKMGKGILATPTVYGNLLIGPDAIDEETKDFHRSTHIERLREIFQSAQEISDKIESKKFLRSFAGTRPVASIKDFIISPSPTKGFINVAGIQSPGLTSSPAIADLVVEILEKEGLELTKNPDYNPYRKPYKDRGKAWLKQEELKERLVIDGEGQIICRCEQVQKSTILDALSRGIPVNTVDGIKRRVRPGMGACQGNFCRSRVVKVMEEFYGRQINPKTDIEVKGDTRVGRKEFLESLKEEKETQKKTS